MNAIETELTDATRIAQFRQLQIHLVAAHEAPATMHEIGRIREREFRAVGAGRGADVDIDRFDLQWPWYLQLVSWDPEDRVIVAMYRAIHCGWALRHGGLETLRTTGLFKFSDRFVHEQLQYAVELGRSVVNRQARQALAGLFSIWTGLGALVREWTDVRSFFGNVSLYRSLPRSALSRVLEYLFRYHAAPRGSVSAIRPADTNAAVSSAGEAQDRESAAHALEQLQQAAADEGWIVPPILLSYLKAHPGLVAFDVAEDDDFGGALEVAIQVPVAGVSARTVQRFIDPYRSINPQRFRLPQNQPEVLTSTDRELQP